MQHILMLTCSWSFAYNLVFISFCMGGLLKYFDESSNQKKEKLFVLSSAFILYK